MTVLLPSLSDATAGTRAPLHVLYTGKMSSSHSPEELIKRVFLSEYPMFGCKCSINEVSSITRTPVNVVPTVLLKMTEVTDDCGRTRSCVSFCGLLFFNHKIN